jgi:hypothetical protein
LTQLTDRQNPGGVFSIPTYFPPIPESSGYSSPPTRNLARLAIATSRSGSGGEQRNFVAELEGSPVTVGSGNSASHGLFDQYREDSDVESRDLDCAVEETIRRAPESFSFRYRNMLGSQRVVAEALVASGYEPPEVTEEGEMG